MRVRTFLLSLVAAVGAVLGPAAPARAVTVDQKVSVLAVFTQPTAASARAWNAARLDPGAWAGYGFDWSTDYCSDSPDQPLGFDFRLPCERHDFGYRNYKAVGLFVANKERVDNAFYFDLRTRCATYAPLARPLCYGLAWTYYKAVRDFGRRSTVDG